MTDDLLDRERPWDAAAIDRLLLDIALALLERHRGQIDAIALELVGYYSLGLRDLHEITVRAWLAGQSIGTVPRRELGEEAEALFAAHEIGAEFLREFYRDQLRVAGTGTIVRDRVAAHRLLTALARLGLN